MHDASFMGWIKVHYLVAVQINTIITIVKLQCCCVTTAPPAPRRQTAYRGGGPCRRSRSTASSRICTGVQPRSRSTVAAILALGFAAKTYTRPTASAGSSDSSALLQGSSAAACSPERHCHWPSLTAIPWGVIQ
jgi:hypothetical protein